MNFKNKYFFALIYFGVTLFAFSQNKNIVVVSSEFNEPLPGVFVRYGNNFSTTNQEGRLKILTALPKDTLILEGFDIMTTKVTVGSILNDSIIVKLKPIELEPLVVQSFNIEKFLTNIIQNIPENYQMDMNLNGVVRERFISNNEIHRLFEASTNIKFANILDYNSPLNEKLYIENFNKKYFKNVNLHGKIPINLPSSYYYKNILLDFNLNKLLSIKSNIKLKSKETSDNGKIRMKFISDTLQYDKIEGAKYITNITMELDSTMTKLYKYQQDVQYIDAKIESRIMGIGSKFIQDLTFYSFLLNFSENDGKLILTNYEMENEETLKYKEYVENLEFNLKIIIFESVGNNGTQIKSPINFNKPIHEQIVVKKNDINVKIYFPLTTEEKKFLK